MGGCGRVFGRGIIQQVSNLLPKSNLEKKRHGSFPKKNKNSLWAVLLCQMKCLPHRFEWSNSGVNIGRFGARLSISNSARVLIFNCAMIHQPCHDFSVALSKTVSSAPRKQFALLFFKICSLQLHRGLLALSSFMNLSACSVLRNPNQWIGLSEADGADHKCNH